jgi:hypothetical protein
MAMATIEIPMVIKCFGWPGIEISNFCESALIMSWKSSREPSMIARLTSVTDYFFDSLLDSLPNRLQSGVASFQKFSLA